ncbi:MAG: helix-turn-helix domain-containing protein, partial [Oscillospiraceae bacterium]
WYALGEVNTMRDIGANIRRARVRRKLTQDDLAQTVHTTRQTISNYETGRSRPDVETLQRLADALSVELTELLDGAPSADARRAALRRVCIMGAVTLILAGLWAYLHAVCLRQYQRGDMAPLAAMLITEPLLLCALGAPARPGAVRPVSGNSGRQRCSARLRRDIAAAVWRPCCHGSAVFSPRRAALADAAGHRTVKLHKHDRQKFASAGFLPFSAQKCHAALHFTDRRGILFSLEKHMSATRGQFSSDLK